MCTDIRPHAFDAKTGCIPQSIGEQVCARAVSQHTDPFDDIRTVPKPDQDTRRRKFPANAADRISDLSRVRRIEVRETNDGHAIGFQSKDIIRRQCPRSFDARTEPVRVAELGEHYPSRFVERGSTRDTQNWIFSLPFDRKFGALKHRQIGINRLSRGSLDGGSGFRVSSRLFARRFAINLFGEVVREFQNRVANPDQPGLVECVAIEVGLRELQSLDCHVIIV